MVRRKTLSFPELSNWQNAKASSSLVMTLNQAKPNSSQFWWTSWLALA
jgi:hypothetical protein